MVVYTALYDAQIERYKRMKGVLSYTWLNIDSQTANGKI